jgi:hypothetical protein
MLPDAKLSYSHITRSITLHKRQKTVHLSLRCILRRCQYLECTALKRKMIDERERRVNLEIISLETLKENKNNVRMATVKAKIQSKDFRNT